MEVDPKEFELEFFKEEGFVRRRGSRCPEFFWTLNEDFSEPQDAPCVEYWFDEVPGRRGLDVRGSRETFLSFFERRGHEVVSPRPVVARWREDLYLTIASIVAFQPHVTSGIVPPPANPLAISQPSIRLEDIDNVGVTLGRHLTSFEMAAHHAFNYPDKPVYWKEETVRYAFEFFTKELGIPAEYIVFKESWWEGGGNAGPCFEVAVGGLELATLVFMKYRTVNGGYEEIPIKIVDTGYGVERIAWFSQRAPTAFQAIYGGLVGRFRELLGVKEPDKAIISAAFKAAGMLDPESEESLRRYYERVSKVSGAPLGHVASVLEREARLYSVLDHTKTLALMLGDGVVPSNTGEGYLARLVARRTLKQILLLGSEASLEDLVKLQVYEWKGDFPQLGDNLDYILEAARLEEERFRRSLDRGVKLVERELRKRKRIGVGELVKFYDAHGVPPEIVAEVGARSGARVEVPSNFYSMIAAMHKSPAQIKGKQEQVFPREIAEWARSLPKTRLLFHEEPYMGEFEARVVSTNGPYLVLDATAFYPTGGGQIHDTGVIRLGGSDFRVVEVQVIDGVVVHKLDREIPAEPGDSIHGVIDWRRRYRIMRHHTATHIVLAAARRVLGSHVWQAGAEKTEEKGRLDIKHHKPLSAQEVRAIEEHANRIVEERRPVIDRVMDKNEAELKYGLTIYQGGVPMERRIRIVEVPGWDVEACFGTHVKNTGEVGSIKIVGYERIQDGVVRLEYVCGVRTTEVANELEDKLREIAERIGAGKGQEIQKLDSVMKSLEESRRAIKRYRDEWVGLIEKRVEEASPTQGVRVLAIKALERDLTFIREALKRITSRYPDSVIAIIVYMDGSSQVELACGSKACKSLPAREAVGALIKSFGGRGGGSQSYASARLPGSLEPGSIELVIKGLLVRPR